MPDTEKSFFTRKEESLAVEYIRHYKYQKEFLTSLDEIGKKYSFYKRQSSDEIKKELNIFFTEDFLSLSASISYNKLTGKLNSISFLYNDENKEQKEFVEKVFKSITDYYQVEAEETEKAFSSTKHIYMSPQSVAIIKRDFKDYVNGRSLNNRFDNLTRLTLITKSGNLKMNIKKSLRLV